MEALPLDKIEPLDIGVNPMSLMSLKIDPPKRFLVLTIRLLPFSKYVRVPGAELYGQVVQVGGNKFKVVGLSDIFQVGREVMYRELTLQQQ